MSTISNAFDKSAVNLNTHTIMLASEDVKPQALMHINLRKIKNDLERKGEKFDPNKGHYLINNSNASGSFPALRQFQDEKGIQDLKKVENFLGTDAVQCTAKQNDDMARGGFTFNNTKAAFDAVFGSNDEVGLTNSLMLGTPFSFGINYANVNMPQPPIPSFEDFMTAIDMGQTTTNTLFGLREVFTEINFAGTPTDISGGANALTESALNAEGFMQEYRTFGTSLNALKQYAASSSQGYSGDKLAQDFYGKLLENVKMWLNTALGNWVYDCLQNATDSNGNLLNVTTTLGAIAPSLAGKTLPEAFADTSSRGLLFTQFIPAITAAGNQWLNVNQRKLSRAVLPNVMASSLEQDLVTFPFTGQTQGQVASGINGADLFKKIAISLGADINVDGVGDPKPEDMRAMFVTDALTPDPLYSFFKMVYALKPTIMAQQSTFNATNEVYLTRASKPHVSLEKCALFITGK